MVDWARDGVICPWFRIGVLGLVYIVTVLWSRVVLDYGGYCWAVLLVIEIWDPEEVL